MPKRHIVMLAPQQRKELQTVVHQGRDAARRLTCARILLKADQGPQGPGWSDGVIAEALEVGLATVQRARRCFCQEGLQAASGRKPPSRTRSRRLNGAQEAHLIALACSEAPEGRSRWTLRLLAGKTVELGHVESLSYGTVRYTLTKTN